MDSDEQAGLSVLDSSADSDQASDHDTEGEHLRYSGLGSSDLRDEGARMMERTACGRVKRLGEERLTSVVGSLLASC
jgi:hypothetical protein